MTPTKPPQPREPVAWDEQWFRVFLGFVAGTCLGMESMSMLWRVVTHGS